MTKAEFQQYLNPRAERDEGFRQEIVRQSVRGLAVAGGVHIAVSIFLEVARFGMAPDPLILPMRLAECAVMIGIGLCLLLLSQQPRVAPYARGIGLASALVTAMVLMWFSLSLCAVAASADDFIPGQITLILLVGISAYPVRPLQTLGLGFCMLAGYIVSARTAERLAIPQAELQPTFVLFILMLTLLSTALTAIVYAERSQSYFRYQQALKAEREVKDTQRQMLLSENAASLGRLAAALSHELNSPIGALSSAVDTLLLLSARQSSKPMDQQRFLILLNDLRKTIQDSASRLSTIVSRMQRISNLDRSEVQRVSVNELITDVVQLCGSKAEQKAQIEMQLGEVPPMICKPHQLSAVFRNLLNNSMDALNGSGRIRIVTQTSGKNIAVEITDNGTGMDETQLKGLFDPEFRVADGRVGTGNWSMFSSRQVVREHGGDIEVESTRGAGTRVMVSFPIQQFQTLS